MVVDGVVMAIVGARFGRTVQVRVCAAVAPVLSSAVTVTSMSWAAAATAGAVSVKLQAPAVLVTALIVPSVVAAVTVTVLSGSSASRTVPLMVVTERPSTVAGAVVKAIAGGWLARTVQVRVCGGCCAVAVLGCDCDFDVLGCSCDGRRGQREAPSAGRVGYGADCAQRCCCGDCNGAGVVLGVADGSADGCD